jgi:hypothetical protein
VKGVEEEKEEALRSSSRGRVPGGLDVELRGLGGEAGGLEVVGGLGLMGLGVAVGGLRLVAGSSEVLVGGFRNSGKSRGNGSGRVVRGLEVVVGGCSGRAV